MREDFEKYLYLYKKGVNINKINPVDDQTYRVLVGSGLDIRIIDRDQHLALIYSLPNLTNFAKDSEDYSSRFFYAIPIQTVRGTIVGFIFRSVFGKSYATVNREASERSKKLPLMFGFYKDFADFDSHEECKPIIVCEGLKDCIVLKKIYPYVLANNTSSMGINLQVLSNLTDKFILIYDNDKAGQDGMERDAENIRKLKYDAITIHPKSCYKDSADCYDNQADFLAYSNLIKEKIALFEQGRSLSNARSYLYK